MMSCNHVRALGEKLLILFLITQVTARLWAQNVPITLDLASVAKLAESDDLTIKASQKSMAAAREKTREVEALRWGRVDTNAQYLRFNDPILITIPPVALPFAQSSLAVSPVRIAPQDNVHVRLEATLPVFTGGKIWNSIREAREAEMATKSIYDDTRASSTYEAEQDYLGVLLTREVVRLNEEALVSYQKHLHDARIAYTAGVVARYDLIRAETAVEEQTKRLTEARNEYDITEAALRTALVLPQDVPLNVDGTLFEVSEALSLEQLQQTAIGSNPALRAMAHKVEALHRAERVELADYFPTLAAIAGKELATDKLAQTDPHWYAGAHADLSLFDGGARRARVKEASAETAKARFEYQHASAQLLLAIRKAFLELDSQHSALNSARKAEELAEESLRLATRRFAVGTGTSLEVLDANVALTGARIGVQTSLYQIDVAYLGIHRYVGDLSEVISKVQP